MERQAAYDLFTCFLKKRQIKGIDLQKELPGLLTYGYAKGCFQNPHTVHELEEWRKFGDKIWEAVLDDDKTAKKLGKLWRVVHNELLQHQVEKRAAHQATAAQEKNKGYTGWSDCPLPPAVSTVVLPPPAGEGSEDPLPMPFPKPPFSTAVANVPTAPPRSVSGGATTTISN